MKLGSMMVQFRSKFVTGTVLSVLSICSLGHAKFDINYNSSCDLSRSREKKKEICSECEKKTVAFGKNEINKTSGFVITKPGKYCLKEHVVSKKADIAITVASSNVVIDLNGYTLSGKNGVSTTGIFASGTTNLVIENGTIRNFSVNGIRLEGEDNVLLDDLLVLRNGAIAGPDGTGGLLVLDSSYVDMTELKLSENFQFGLGMSGVDTANFIDSSVDGTQGFNAPGFFGNVATGILVSSTGPAPFVSGSRNLNFINDFINNTLGGDSSFGMFLDSIPLFGPIPSNTNINIENCLVKNTSQTNVTPTSAFAPFCEGITVGGAFDVTIKDCTVDTLIGASTIEGAGHLVGIELAATDRAIIEGCSVSNVVGIATYVHGFDIEGSGNDITIRDCITYGVINNSVNPTHLALGYGILKPIGFPSVDAVGTGTIVQNVIAEDVHGPNGALATGLLINAQQNVVVEDSIFNKNDIGILAQDILPGLVSSNGLIRRNVTDGNLFYGIRDLSSANNAYYGNTARANGIANFSGLPANTPIVIWTIGTPPIPSNGFVLDNYDIRP